MAGRNFLAISFIERPLFIGLVWWTCGGEFVPTLPLAIFFELFWIDLIPVGGYIPPMPCFPYVLLLSFSGVFGWADAQSIAFPLLVCLPLAYVIPLLEAYQRGRQKGAYHTLLKHVRDGERTATLPGKLVIVSSAQILLFTYGAFLVVWGSLFVFFSLPLVQRIIFFPFVIDWPVFYVVAATGSLLALRIKRAYVLFIFCVIGVQIVLLSN